MYCASCGVWGGNSVAIDAIDTLVAAGADIEAPGAVIGDGTPLADATTFGQWNATRRLIEHGAQSTLWESAALGLADRVIKYCNDNHPAAARTSPRRRADITRQLLGRLPRQST